jgi:hypothetical protein
VASLADDTVRPEPIDVAALLALWLRPWLWSLHWYIRLSLVSVLFTVAQWVLLTDHADAIASFADVRDLLRHGFLEARPALLLTFIAMKVVYDALRACVGRTPYWLTDVDAAFAGVDGQAARLDRPQQLRPRDRALRRVIVWVPVMVVALALSEFFRALLHAVTIDTGHAPGFALYGALTAWSIILASGAAATVARHWTGVTQWPIWPARRARIAARIGCVRDRVVLPRPRRRWLRAALPWSVTLSFVAGAGAVAARYMFPLHHQDLGKGQYDNMLVGFYIVVVFAAAMLCYATLTTWAQGPADTASTDEPGDTANKG